MKSSVIKRSIMVAGHKTSVSLEDPFWQALKEIAAARDTKLADVIGSIDAGRQHSNLSSAIRLFVLNHFQMRTGGGAHHTRDHMPQEVMISQ